MKVLEPAGALIIRRGWRLRGAGSSSCRIIKANSQRKAEGLPDLYFFSGFVRGGSVGVSSVGCTRRSSYVLTKSVGR